MPSSPRRALPSNITVSVLGVSKKDSVEITKAKKASPNKRASKFSRESLHVLVDANKLEHLVCTVQTIHNPTVARVCFVDSRGRHSLVDPSILSPAPANIDLSAVDRWWEGCVLPQTRADTGTAYFPPPFDGFKRGDFVTVCIPDIDPLPALVSETYPAAILTGRQYRVLYSQDSPYDSGVVAALEVTGPAITFNPATDFQVEAPLRQEEDRALSPADWSMPIFESTSDAEEEPLIDFPPFDRTSFLTSDDPFEFLSESLECTETLSPPDEA